MTIPHRLPLPTARRRPNCVLRLLLLLLLPAIFAAADVRSALGDELPLLVDVDSSTNQMRTTGPIPMSVRLQWAGGKPVLNGDLILHLIDSEGARVATAVLDNLHLSQGTQRFDFLLPALDADHWDTQFTLRSQFVTSDGRYPLREQTLFLSGAGRRTFVATIVSSAGPSERDAALRFGEALRFDRFFEIDRSANETPPALTLFRREQVRDLPTNPLAHCRQDLLIFVEEAFAGLSSPQLSAVEAWTRAGGSVAVFLDDSPLTGPQFEGLHHLLGKDADSGLLSRNTAGQILWPDNGTKVFSGSCGLGRAVVAPHAEVDRLLGADLPVEWVRIVCALWGIRADQCRAVIDSGAFSWEIMSEYASMHPMYTGSAPSPPGSHGPWSFRPQPIAGGSALLRETLPRGMRVVPLWIMALTLLGYILLIGPGEYFGLGMLRARRYTWITFPLVTLLFTGGAIAMSNLMMAGADQGGSITFVDVAPTGHITRENEIKLMFTANSGRQEIGLVNALYSPLDHRRLGAQNVYQISQRDPQTGSVVPPLVQGMLPNRGTVIESLSKWSPKLYRVLRIPAEPKLESSGFDWTAPADPRDPASLQELRARLTAAFGPGVQARLWRRNGRGDREFSDFREMGEELDVIDLVGNGPLMPADDEHMAVQVSRGSSRFSTYESPDFLKCASIREQGGLFAIVSRVAPKCDNFLEDLAILDAADDKAWLLIVAVSQENRWTVYRRIYRVD